MTVALRVTVRLFARLREQAGTDRAELELAAGATAADAYQELRRLHPGLEARREAVRVAVNEEFSGWETPLSAGDEVAFIPPVSGGSPEVGVLFELTDQPLDARRLETAVARAGAGAICTFTGVVRDNSLGRQTERLEYEAYEGMVESQMRAIAAEIAGRWPETRVAIAHRTGVLEIGEASVVVSVSSPHRADAIAACKWGIDRLKESVPIWKKEIFEGGEEWVEGDHSPPEPTG